jgi:hypothetical protein
MGEDLRSSDAIRDESVKLISFDFFDSLRLGLSDPAIGTEFHSLSNRFRGTLSFDPPESSGRSLSG